VGRERPVSVDGPFAILRRGRQNAFKPQAVGNEKPPRKRGPLLGEILPIRPTPVGSKGRTPQKAPTDSDIGKIRAGKQTRPGELQLKVPPFSRAFQARLRVRVSLTALEGKFEILNFRFAKSFPSR